MGLITDRTEADVLLKTEKGQYSAADLNRVEQAVGELCVLATQLDIHLNLTVKTDWCFENLFSKERWPVKSQMDRYINNVHKICDAFDLQCDLPDRMRGLNWEKANKIENALDTAYQRVRGILHTYQYSGELIAGEESQL